MHTSWGKDLVEVKKSQKEDSSAPTGGNYDSPSGLLGLHTISSIFIPLFPLSSFFLSSFFFLHPIFSFIYQSTPSIPPYTFPSLCPPASHSTACKLSSSFCSPPLFQAVICLPPPSHVSPSLHFSPAWLAYPLLVLSYSVSVTNSAALPPSPVHWGLQRCRFSFQLSNQGIILHPVNAINYVVG